MEILIQITCICRWRTGSMVTMLEGIKYRLRVVQKWGVWGRDLLNTSIRERGSEWGERDISIVYPHNNKPKLPPPNTGYWMEPAENTTRRSTLPLSLSMLTLQTLNLESSSKGLVPYFEKKIVLWIRKSRSMWLSKISLLLRSEKNSGMHLLN